MWTNCPHLDLVLCDDNFNFPLSDKFDSAEAEASNRRLFLSFLFLFLYVAIIAAGVVVAYHAISDVIHSYNNPVRSTQYKEINVYKPPGKESIYLKVTIPPIFESNKTFCNFVSILNFFGNLTFKHHNRNKNSVIRNNRRTSVLISLNIAGSGLFNVEIFYLFWIILYA